MLLDKGFHVPAFPLVIVVSPLRSIVFSQKISIPPPRTQNQARMAMQKPSCKNTPQYLTSCCSPIGQNNTKDFSAQSGGNIGRAVWKWSGKSLFPGAFFALLANMRRFISLPDFFPLALTNCPWVSEDELISKIVILVSL